MDANNQYLAAKINPILEPLVTELLIAKPSNPAEFMIKWLQSKYGKSSGDQMKGRDFLFIYKCLGAPAAKAAEKKGKVIGDTAGRVSEKKSDRKCNTKKAQRTSQAKM